MRPLELIPDISCCIETTAKKEYEEAVTEYLGRKEVDAALEERIELLCAFLQSADFSDLRRESETYLTQGRKIKFLLHPGGEIIHYEMLVE